MYDEVRVYFEDGGTTVVFVHVDDNIQDTLADLEDTFGVDVSNYTILGTVDTGPEGCEDEEIEEANYL